MSQLAMLLRSSPCFPHQALAVGGGAYPRALLAQVRCWFVLCSIESVSVRVVADATSQRWALAPSWRPAG